MIVSLFVFVIILVLSIPSAAIFIPLAVVTGNVGPLYTVTCFIVRTGFRVAGIRVKVEGRENVPASKACIFIYCLKLGGFIPVDRKGNAITAQESVAAAKRILDKGIHITTFVEGTRSPDGRMLLFKKGPFYLAMETGAPCIPVSIYGTETLMSKGSFGIKPGTAHFVFHAPINPGDYATRDELMQAVRAAIASGLPEWMRG
jgi:1-acyl-sn-glycerol-3-phosphate acyltransferase